MKTTPLRAASAAVLAIFVSACAGGPLLGGGSGAATTQAKVTDGGLVGSAVSGSLNRQALKAALDSEYQALEFARPDEPVKWAAGGASGEVNAASPYQVGEQNCRAYEHTVFGDGAPTVLRGTACRNGDGTWTPLT